MANIQSEINHIAGAVYGRDVRQSIINALEKVNEGHEETQQLRDDAVAAGELVSEAQDTLMALNRSIVNGDTLKSQLTTATSTANTAKSNLTTATSTANTAKSNLDGSIQTGNTLKENLDGSIENAQSIKTTLDQSIEDGDILALREDFLATKGTFLADCCHTATARGDFITLTDSANAPIPEIVLYGKSTQAGTPDPETPAEIVSAENPEIRASGKNLWTGEWTDLSPSGSSSAGYTVSRYSEAVTTLVRVKPNTRYTFRRFAPTSQMHVYGAAVKPYIGYKGMRYVTSGVAETQVLRVNTGPTDNWLMLRLSDTGEAVDKIQFELDDGTENIYTGVQYSHGHIEGITLKGLPVLSEETYIDKDGNKWISDELHIRADGTGYLVKRTHAITVDHVNGVSGNGGKRAIIRDLTCDGGHTAKETMAAIGYLAISDRLPSGYGGELYNGTLDYGVTSSNGYVSIRLTDDYNNSVVAYNTWLSSHPLNVVYALETPEITELTSAQVKGLLINTLKPLTNLSSDVNADIEVRYVQDPAKVVDSLQSQIDAILLMLGNAVCVE